MPGDFDWSLNGGGSIMDLDIDNDGRLSALSGSAARKLEFVDVDSEALGLSGLDISFDAKAAQDGKIRVRIHPPASTPPTSAPSPDSHSDSGDDQSMYGGSDASGPTSSVSSSSLAGALGSQSSASKMAADSDPFLGIGGDIDFCSLFRQSGMSLDTSSSQFSFPDLDFGDSFGASSSGRKRVRIALKTLPGEGAEGGEWEVQLC